MTERTTEKAVPRSMEKIRYRLQITTLTPLHVGSGVAMQEGMDFIAHDKWLWVAHQGKLMEAILAEAEKKVGNLAAAAEAITDMTLYELRDAGWLRNEHFDLDKHLFRYRLQGKTSTTDKRGRLAAQMKDVYGQPYVPGSTLKGALRSVLLRAAAEQDQNAPLISRWRRGRGFDGRFAAQELEQRHFVPANVERRDVPNYDLWRAVQVTDSGKPEESDGLHLGHALVFPTKSGGERGIVIDLEIIPAGTTFTAELRIDPWLFYSPEAAKLGFLPQHLAQFDRRLVRTVVNDSRKRLMEEITYFQSRSNQPNFQRPIYHLDQVADVYTKLQKNEMVMQIGKGPGWQSKTIGRVLVERLNQQEFDAFVTDFDMGRGYWTQDRPLPFTRQIVSEWGVVDAPMGWVKIGLEPVK